MDPKLIAKQVMDFNKFVFDSGFNTMCVLQDMTGKAVSTYVQQMPWIPEESKRVFDDWMNAVKSGRERFKSAVDENYKKTGECLHSPQ